MRIHFDLYARVNSEHTEQQNIPFNSQFSHLVVRLLTILAYKRITFSIITETIEGIQYFLYVEQWSHAPYASIDRRWNVQDELFNPMRLF